MVKLLRFAIILFLAECVLAQQPQKASIEGIVVSLSDGEPLADATVQLDRWPGDEDPVPLREGSSHFAHTNQEGRFVFDDVEPGNYLLIATHSGGFVPGEYGQRTPTGTGVPFRMAAGEKRAGIRLALASTGAISGRVFDHNGDPVGRGQVQALQSIYNNGHKKLTIVQIVQTNDRGEYRLFWLPPGTYYVSAKPDIAELPSFAGQRSPPGAAVRITEPGRFSSYEQASAPIVKKRVLKTGEVVEELNVPVFYPGVVDPTGAAPIQVTASGTMGGIDIPIASGIVPARHIRGRVISGVDGQTIANAYVTAYPRSSDPLYSTAGSKVEPNGLFDISGVQPGSYTLAVTTSSMNGQAAVQVAGNDVENFVVVVQPRFALNGQFSIDGRSASGKGPRMEDLRISNFTPTADVHGSPVMELSFVPPPGADGVFHFEGASAGDFRVWIDGVPKDAYVQSIFFGDTDVLDSGIHLVGPTDTLLQIVIGANAGSIDGSVVDSQSRPLANRSVVLAPDVRLRHRADLYHSVSTDSSGHFQFRGLSPGDYKLFAWEDVPRGAWEDPEFLAGFEGRGLPTRINEGPNSTVQVTVIP
jgi:hypothetical protein